MPRRGAAPEPRRLDELGRNDPCRRPPRQLGARPEGEPRAARAGEVPRPAGTSRRPTCDSRPASSARWISSGSAAAELRAIPADRAARRSCSTRSCHSRMRSTCRNSALQRRRNALPDSALLLLAHVLPQLAAARGNPSPRRRSARAPRRPAASLLGRPLARILDRQRGRDHDHLRRAAEPRRPPAPSAPSADRAGSCASWRPIRVSRARRLSSAPELLQQRDPVAHLAAVGRIEEREVLDVARAAAPPSAGSPRRGSCAGSPDR